MNPKELFTVEQVAMMLDLHPRTIRRYIRDGKLKATKVGGEWRVKGVDLGELLDGEAVELKKQTTDDVWGFVRGTHTEYDDKLQVCTIIDFYVETPEDATPMSQALIGLMGSGDPEQRNAKFQYFYDQNEHKARFILWGNPKFLAKMLVVAGEYA